MSQEDPKLRILRRKAMSKANDYACENDLDNLKEIMEDPELRLPIDPKPSEVGAPRENSLLGEAAIGNAVACAEYCLAMGADPNYVGEKQRTVLYRALHNNALDVVVILLRAGADPRTLLIQPRDPVDPSIVLYREWDPADVNALGYSPEAKQILKNWDPKLLKVAEKRMAGVVDGEKKQQEDKKAEAVKTREALAGMVAKLSELKIKEREAFHKREDQIQVYDLAMLEGKGSQPFLLDLVKAAETALDELRAAIVELEFHVKKEKAKARQLEVEGALSGGLRFMALATLNNVTDTIYSGEENANARHPFLVVDLPNNSCITFMSYRDSFMVRDIGNTKHFHPDNVRVDILKCIRWGRTYVIEARDLELAEEVLPKVTHAMDCVQPGLWLKLCDRTITQKKVYETLVTDAILAADSDLARGQFRDEFSNKFVVVLVTADQFPAQEVLDAFGSIRVVA